MLTDFGDLFDVCIRNVGSILWLDVCVEEWYFSFVWKKLMLSFGVFLNKCFSCFTFLFCYIMYANTCNYIIKLYTWKINIIICCICTYYVLCWVCFVLNCWWFHKCICSNFQVHKMHLMEVHLRNHEWNMIDQRFMQEREKIFSEPISII